jgi:hypothetical protein
MFSKIFVISGAVMLSISTGSTIDLEFEIALCL